MKHTEKEIEEVAKISAETFFYCSFDGSRAKNIYEGKDETGGMCSDYALKFVLLWNEKFPENPAEIVVVNQPKYFMKDGSYKIIRKKIDFDPSSWRWSTPSGFEISDPLCEIVIPGCYHPKIGFYELEQTKLYKVKKHFGIDMVDDYKEPHTWAKVGDIVVDPCWADTDGTPFIGEDIVI